MDLLLNAILTARTHIFVGVLQSFDPQKNKLLTSYLSHCRILGFSIEISKFSLKDNIQAALVFRKGAKLDLENPDP